MPSITPQQPRRNAQPEFNDPVEAIKFHMEAQGLTQRDLVPMIGSRSKVSEVLSGTRSITMPMARALHRHLGISADVLLKEPEVGSSETALDVDWRRFPLRQMAKLGWIEDRGNLREAAEELVKGLMHRAGHAQVDQALFRKNDQNRANAKTNVYALTAWCWQILAQARQKKLPVEYCGCEQPHDLLRKVAQLSPGAEGPKLAVEFLANHGIAVEILRHLPGTHLDGAAMKSADGKPVIGMTLRYDRIDHFWYTLLHELAHAVSHFDGNSEPFFDDLRLESTTDKERDADKLAEEALIPPEDWESSAISQRPSPMAVLALAHQVGVHPAIVAGRARYKSQNYRLLSQFVGTGAVRDLFGV